MENTNMSPAEVPVSATIVPILFDTLEDPQSSSGRVADVVGSDTGLAARVLAVANSAAFGRARQVADIQSAVSLIGANMVQTLAIAGSTSLLDGDGGLPHMRHHAIETACAARLLANRVGLPEADAFAAGLMHDIGELLLWQSDPSAYASAYAGWEDLGAQLRGERGLFGADHATAGREHLTEWGFPGAIIDAVGDHHRPDLHHHDLSTVVAAAEELVQAHGSDADRDRLRIGADEMDRVRDALVVQTEEMSALLRG